MNQLTGSIAVYSLNFNQPASDYLKYRNKLNDNKCSLENVILNRFQITGTIRVKNIHFSKQVFVRCTFNNWQTSEDYQAVYLPGNDYPYSSSSSRSTCSSLSSTFFAINAPEYYNEPKHKEFDTFKFEFQLPKTVDGNQSNTNETNANASIQFCICYRSGTGTPEQAENWDNNDGVNYQILQYIIDIEKLKQPQQQQQNRSYATNVYY
jgi:protein phosphatase 1 regulatory subunit 3A/B/C/D/E